MKFKLFTLLILFSVVSSFAQNRMYNLTTQFDSVKVRKLIMTSILEGSITDSVLVKKQNGGMFKVSRSSFGSGNGTVTSFSKTDGIGIVSSVSNPTTIPNHTVGVDTTVIATKANSNTLSQLQTRFATKQNNIIFGSGLTSSSGTLSLGGNISSNVNLALLGTNFFNVSAGSGVSSAGFFNVGAGAGGINVFGYASSGTGRYISFNNSEASITDDISNKGLVYTANYSANFTARSLIDKGYVDNATAAVNTVSSASTLALNLGYYTFSGTTATWTLPAVSGNTGRRIILINAGTGSVTINSNAGANDIWESGSLVSTLNMNPGETYILYNNSSKYTVIQ